jgi:hypothetical protein
MLAACGKSRRVVKGTPQRLMASLNESKAHPSILTLGAGKGIRPARQIPFLRYSQARSRYQGILMTMMRFVAAQQQHHLQQIGAPIVQQALPPVAHHEFRNQHTDFVEFRFALHGEDVIHHRLQNVAVRRFQQ